MFSIQNRIMTKADSAPHAYQSKKNGFSLIELMVAMAIFLIFSTVLMNVFSSSTRTYTVQEAGVEASQSVRACMDFMVREIRHAGYDPTGSGVGVVLTATANQISFTADYNGNGTIDADDELSVFQLIGDTVQLTDFTGISYPLVTNVTNLTFSYLSEGNVDMGFPVGADLDNIMAVGINMTVRQPAGSEAPVSRTLNTEVMCRNLWFKD